MRSASAPATGDRPSDPGGCAVIRTAAPADLAATARLHVDLLPAGLFPALGIRFVRRWHATYLASPHGIALVAEDPAGRIAGFLIGAADHRAYMSGLMADRRAVARLSVAGAAGLLRRPRLIGRFLRTRAPRWLLRVVLHRRPDGAPGADPPGTALVDAVAVRPGLRGTGVARAMLRRFLREAGARGVRSAQVVTAVGPSGAGDFYVRLGWRPAGTYRSWDGAEVRVLRRVLRRERPGAVG